MKQVEPVNKRKYHAFLSHSSKDKVAFVERLYQWFTKFAEIPVWYDKHEIGRRDFRDIHRRFIPKCRSMIIILSKSAIASGWVEQEYSLALNHAMQYRKFRVIPILIDDSAVPGFLENRTYIKVQENQLDIDFYNDLLQAMYYGDTDIEYDTVQDIYVSRTWHRGRSPVRRCHLQPLHRPPLPADRRRRRPAKLSGSQGTGTEHRFKLRRTARHIAASPGK